MHRFRDVGGRILRVTAAVDHERMLRAYMSLHDEHFGDACIGPARAWRMEIPYCTVCEAETSRYGCIHMSESELNLPSVIEASRPFPAQLRVKS